MKRFFPLFWFAAVFLAIFGSRLLIIERFGSALPWWDQWAVEGWSLYIPFLEHNLALKDLFAAHCEHRPFVNRVLGLLLLVLNGQWDARLGMVFNAALTAGTGVALSVCGWVLIGRKNIASFCLFNTLIFSLPFSWECTLLGFVGNYLLIAFALGATWFLVESRPLSGRWLLGFAFALISLLTMASGFFAAAAVMAIIVLRVIRREKLLQIKLKFLLLNITAAVLLLVLITAGLLLMVSVPSHEAFKPANIHDLLFSFFQNLAWPNADAPWTALIIWTPCLLLLFEYVFRRGEEWKTGEFILAFGIWAVMQSAALALLRSGIIASRHTVFLSLALPINFLAFLFLWHRRHQSLLLRNCLVIILLIWMGNTGYDLWKISGKTMLAEAAKTKKHLVQCEKNVRAFVQTDDNTALANKPQYDIPFPDPNALAIALRHPRIRAILPSCVADFNKPGPLSVFADKLIPKGDKFLILGIAVLTILTGIRSYQSLGTLEKRLTALRWSDFKIILKQAFLVLAAAALIFTVHKLYLTLSPSGLKVTYFRGKNFEEKICERTEKAVCRDYEDKIPAWGVPAKNFSALWQGVLKVPETAEYAFFSQSDDGLRLIIDGVKIIDNWNDQSWGASAASATAQLTAGDHPIAIEHYNNEGESALRIKWSGGPIPPNTILAAPYLRKTK